MSKPKPAFLIPLYLLPSSASVVTYLLDALLLRSGDTVVAVAGVPRSAFPLYMYSGSSAPAGGAFSIDGGSGRFLFFLCRHRKNPSRARTMMPNGIPTPIPTFIPMLLDEDFCVEARRGCTAVL